MRTSAVSIEDVPLNRFHQVLTIRSGCGWIMDGFILSIVGVSLGPLSKDLGLNEFWEGMIAASALIGIFFGGFFGGWLTDKLGRKKAFFIPPLIFLFCSLGQFWANSGEMIFLMRFIIGIGVGIEYPVAGSLLVEFLPKKYRGSRLALLTVLWFAGAAVSYVVGNAIMATDIHDNWRWVLASPAALALIILILRVGTPESPRWLLKKGRAEEADAVMKQVYGPSFSLANLPEQAAAKKISFFNLLHSDYGKRMFFVGVFWTCSVTPIFAVYAFAPMVLSALKLTGEWAAYGSIAITFLFVGGCIIGTNVIDILGRRRMLIHSLFWSGLALLGLGLFSDASPVVVMAFFSIYAVVIGGAQVLQQVYPNEIFPTEIRAAAVGVGTSISRVGAAIGTWLVPISLSKYGISDTMLAATAITMFGFVVSWFMAPETMNVSLEEAAALKPKQSGTGQSRIAAENER